MEKRPEINRDKIISIIITGPESTGKTLITKYLSGIFDTVYVPEYARDYIGNLKRKYSYDDVVHIAKKQIELERELLGRAKGILFYDTFLIITRTWFQVVFNKVPGWIDDHIRQVKWDLFLLCKYDIPWESDPVRENPGEMRIRLFDMYYDQIRQLDIPCKIITGSGDKRYANASLAVREFLDTIETT